LNALLALVVLITAVLSVGIGILATYGVVTGILNAFGRSTLERTVPAPVLIPSESHASGD